MKILIFLDIESIVDNILDSNFLGDAVYGDSSFLNSNQSFQNTNHSFQNTNHSFLNNEQSFQNSNHSFLKNDQFDHQSFQKDDPNFLKNDQFDNNEKMDTILSMQEELASLLEQFGIDKNSECPVSSVDTTGMFILPDFLRVQHEEDL